jgi:hypothetical protein
MPPSVLSTCSTTCAASANTGTDSIATAKANALSARVITVPTYIVYVMMMEVNISVIQIQIRGHILAQLFQMKVLGSWYLPDGSTLYFVTYNTSTNKQSKHRAIISI